jgi:hypothetical protein
VTQSVISTLSKDAADVVTGKGTTEKRQRRGITILTFNNGLTVALRVFKSRHSVIGYLEIS